MFSVGTFGAVKANTDEHLRLLNYNHDLIGFFQSLLNTNFAEFRRFYEEGRSLREISQQTGFPVSAIRSQLLQNNVALRPNQKANGVDRQKPQRAFWGSIPFGFTVLDGKLVIDPKGNKGCPSNPGDAPKENEFQLHCQNPYSGESPKQNGTKVE